MGSTTARKTASREVVPADPATLSHWWRWVNITLAVLLLLLHLPRFTVTAEIFASNLFAPSDEYFYYDFGAYYIAAAVLNSGQPILYNDQVAAKIATTLNMQTRHSHGNI